MMDGAPRWGWYCLGARGIAVALNGVLWAVISILTGGFISILPANLLVLVGVFLYQSADSGLERSAPRRHPEWTGVGG
jgi:hypothetical protein